MRKTRQRALRAEFRKANGRPPEGAPEYAKAYPGGPYRMIGVVSMWRRLKKAHLVGRAGSGAVADRAITAATKDAARRARKRVARRRAEARRARRAA